MNDWFFVERLESGTRKMAQQLSVVADLSEDIKFGFKHPHHWEAHKGIQHPILAILGTHMYKNTHSDTNKNKIKSF